MPAFPLEVLALFNPIPISIWKAEAATMQAQPIIDEFFPQSPSRRQSTSLKLDKTFL